MAVGQKTISSSFTVSVQEKGDTGAQGPQGPQGNDGTSPYIADIDNQMDSIRCLDDGKPVAAQSVTANLQMYHGSSSVSGFSVSVTRNGSAMPQTGVSHSYNSGSRVLTISYTTAATVLNAKKDDFEITLSATEGGSTITRSVHLYVNAVSGDIYNLKTSVSEISVGRTDAGGYNPSTFSLKCGYTRKDINGTITSVDDVTGQIDSKYYVYYRRRTRSSQAYENYLLYSSNKGNLTSLDVSTYDSVQFIMCTGMSSNTPAGVIDIEDVPVVADGTKGTPGTPGDSAAQAYANPDNFVVLCNTSGSVISSTSQVVAFSMKVGNNAATNVNYTAPSSLPTGVSVSSSTPESATITVGTTATASGLKSGVTFTISGTYGGKTYSVPVTVAIIGAVKGATGESITGHTGRFFYYAGEWSSSRIYYFEKNQAPYVKASNGSFYMLDYAAHPDIQASDTTRQVDSEFNPISHAGGDPWSLMSSEQQYYIAKAFFGEYAQFGSFIINGDWMISTQGTMNGVESTSYTYFDPLFAGGAINCLVKSIQISSGTTTQISSNFNLLGGKDYDFNVTAYGLGANTTLTVTIRRKSGSSWTLVHTFENWTGTTKSMKLATLSSVTAGEYAFFAYASSSGAIIAPVNVSTINAFIPTFAVDGLTGKAYMRNAQVSGQITAEGLVTSNGSFSTEISAGVTTWRSIANPLAYISIGADSDGMFFKMTDKNGALLWDISSGGNGKITGAGGGTYDQLNYKKITNSGTTSTPKFSISEFGYVTDEDTTPYYLYHGQYSMSGNTKTWATINNISESTVDQCVYTSKNADGTSPSSTGYGLTKILDGYYTPVNNGSFMMNADGTYTLKVYRYVSGKQYGDMILYSFNM